MNRRIATVCFALAATASAADEWSGAVSLYGWFPAMDVSATVERHGRSVSAESSATAFDILDALNFGVFGTAELRRGRLGLFGDLFYTDLGVSETGPLGARQSVDTNLFMFTGVAAWRLWADGGSFVDAYGGGRVVSLETDVSAGEASASKSTSYLDPLVGARAGYAVTERVTLNASANIGGFGTGSEFTWEAYAGGNYAFTERVSAELGYRYLSIDYENDGKEIDMQMFGPFTALVVKF
jgi:opacity protein-like surface antigen